jgi:ABC-type multidrug transport system ATPase subunit
MNYFLFNFINILSISDLNRKATGTRVCATNNLCFSIPWGHCFGLLGINGAGKT